MKTLIIHPADRSTTFLDIVYKDIEDKTVVTGGVTVAELNELIESHDRVMMMGHGCPTGLFSVGVFPDARGLIINEQTVPLLQKKDNSVFIWCNADRFVEHYDLKGFYSGMFISEVGEADYCKVYGTDQEIVDESNYGFVNIISKYINEDKNAIYDKVKQEYGLIAESNPVAYYNNNRLYKS
jgi:hypothetical protein